MPWNSIIKRILEFLNKPHHLCSRYSCEWQFLHLVSIVTIHDVLITHPMPVKTESITSPQIPRKKKNKTTPFKLSTPVLCGQVMTLHLWSFCYILVVSTLLKENKQTTLIKNTQKPCYQEVPILSSEQVSKPMFTVLLINSWGFPTYINDALSRRWYLSIYWWMILVAIDKKKTVLLILVVDS